MAMQSLMSAAPSEADMVQHDRDVRFVPKGDIRRRSKNAPIIGQRTSD
jgi:hypothetical protein